MQDQLHLLMRQDLGIVDDATADHDQRSPACVAQLSRSLLACALPNRRQIVQPLVVQITGTATAASSHEFTPVTRQRRSYFPTTMQRDLAVLVGHGQAQALAGRLGTSPAAGRAGGSGPHAREDSDRLG